MKKKIFTSEAHSLQILALQTTVEGNSFARDLGTTASVRMSMCEEGFLSSF